MRSDKETWLSIVMDANEYPEDTYDSENRKGMHRSIYEMLSMKVWLN